MGMTENEILAAMWDAQIELDQEAQLDREQAEAEIRAYELSEGDWWI